ncbi:carbohydrate porin [Acinetobacter sp. WZC-1]|uniref:carbohydrate porin n=1 Tax=Acinetobacter sp. WZC-1 TaxID=3459034 RepID=UPI00403E1B01
MNLRVLKKNILLISLLSTINISAFAGSAFDTDSPWMLGDWNGKRTELKNQGVDFTVGYTGQFVGVMDADRSGKGSAYADQWTFGSHLDLNKLLNWQDTEAQLTITHRGGQSLNQESDAMKPQFNQTQEIYGRGQTWRLTDLWIKKKFLDQKLDVKVGRFGVGEDFANFDCEFENLALCGGQVGNWAGDQWYNGPVSQWATRIKYNIRPELFTQIGVYERNTVNANATSASDGFNLSTDGSDGAIIPVEIVWQPKALSTQLALPGEYRAGYLFSTVDAQNVKVDYTQPYVPADFDADNHKWAAWLSGKQQLTTHHGDPSRGLTVMGQATFYDSKTGAYSDAENLALVYKGPLDARPKDEIGIGVVRIGVNTDAVNFRGSVDGRGFDSEWDAEIYYGLKATNWLTVRPNIQYIKNIGANKAYGDAWVGGVKFNMDF